MPQMVSVLHPFNEKRFCSLMEGLKRGIYQDVGSPSARFISSSANRKKFTSSFVALVRLRVKIHLIDPASASGSSGRRLKDAANCSEIVRHSDNLLRDWSDLVLYSGPIRRLEEKECEIFYFIRFRLCVGRFHFHLANWPFSPDRQAISCVFIFIPLQVLFLEQKAQWCWFESFLAAMDLNRRRK